jgi:hypothetical protein
MDLNDPKEVKRNKKRMKRLEAIRRGDVDYVMADERGRRFMYELIHFQLGLQDTYPGNDAGLSRHEGKRSIAVKIGGELQERHAEQYLLMITERMAFASKINESQKSAEPEAETTESGDPE